MTNNLTTQPTVTPGQMVESVLIKGDLSSLPQADRAKYYSAVCESLGLNPLTKPFEYITLNGKLTLYALKACTDQLRTIHGVSIVDMTESKHDDVWVVTVKAQNAAGRTDMSKGAVKIDGLKGEALANALMKAETKAKRRVTLSLCGLGMLDESEFDTIPASAIQPPKPDLKVVTPPTLAQLRTAEPVKPDPLAATDQSAPPHDAKTGEILPPPGTFEVTPKAPPEPPADELDDMLPEPLAEVAIPLWFPGGQSPHAHYPNIAGWVRGFEEMVQRIAQSRKFTPEQKREKMTLFYTVNAPIFDGLDKHDQTRLRMAAGIKE